MAYLAPIHRPSSVRHAIKLNLLHPEEECLVLAKANRIEIWSPTPDGLILLHSKAIYGRISMLAKVRPFGAPTDHLFVGTIRFQYFTVIWNPLTRQLDTVQKFADLTEKHLTDSESRDRCLVDPTGQHIVLELFQGVLNMIKVVKSKKKSGGYLDKPQQARISELRVKATAFLHTDTDRPKIAFLYAEKRGDMMLATYRLTDEKSQYSQFDPTKDRENELRDLDPGASLLIPVSKGDADQNKRYISRNTMGAKAQLGGVIVVGETTMLYLDDDSKAVVKHELKEASIFIAWEKYDDLNYFLADDYGMLHLLSITVDGASVTGMSMEKLGKITKATVMVHMGEGILFIASHAGNSQVIRVGTDSCEPHIQVLQTMVNIAPIMDFTVMDMGSREGDNQSNEYSSGQARLVTCSGAFEEGGLRSVRSGVGLEDLGILDDIEDIRGVFSLRSSEQSHFDDTLVVSFPVETRVFTFDTTGGVEEVENYRGLVLSQHTLLTMNLPNGLILQVTSGSARILGLGPSYVIAGWSPPNGEIITAASANETNLLLSSNGVTLISLDLQNRLREISHQSLGDKDQVACIHVPAQVPNIAIVGFWKSGSISILNLANLEVIHSEDLRRANNASIPRDIALTQLLPEELSGPTLFVAMEDGIVLSFNVNGVDYSLSGRKSVVLGTQQARFQILPKDDGLFNVFATCEHPSLIYGSEHRIVYSAVTADNAICVCSFNSEVYPGSVVVATDKSLKISKVDRERRTHVRTLPMGQTVRRIAYSPSERAFGIGCINREVIDNREVVSSSFSLVEDVLFGKMGTPFPLSDQQGSEMIECVIRAELPASYGNDQTVERFIVGTSFFEEGGFPGDEENQRIKGRILILGIDGHKNPYLVHSHSLKGACRRVAVLEGKIVAALVKTVVVYDYIETTEVSAKLTKLATYRTSTLPIDLDITGNIIAVSDLMKSVSLVEYIPGTAGEDSKLEEIARHHESRWSTCVRQIETDTYLETDADGNLMVLKRNTDGATAEDRRRLEETSEMNLGEIVNSIQRIEVEVSSSATVVPKAFLATTEGSIYLFSTILPSSQDLLIRLQGRMNLLVHGLGDIDFNTYRSFKNAAKETSEPYRFVDGELIERFLDVGEDVQEEICRGLGPSVEDIRDVVEELKRLH